MKWNLYYNHKGSSGSHISDEVSWFVFENGHLSRLRVDAI